MKNGIARLVSMFAVLVVGAGGCSSSDKDGFTPSAEAAELQQDLAAARNDQPQQMVAVASTNANNAPTKEQAAREVMKQIWTSQMGYATPIMSNGAIARVLEFGGGFERVMNPENRYLFTRTILENGTPRTAIFDVGLSALNDGTPALRVAAYVCDGAPQQVLMMWGTDNQVRTHSEDRRIDPPKPTRDPCKYLK